jgi:hypothetical protein
VRSPKDRKDDVSDFDAKEMPQPKRWVAPADDLPFR